MSKLTNVKNLFLEKRLFENRLAVAVIIIAILTIALITRLVYLQIIEHHRYVTLSKQNYLAIMPVEPTRGLIYDRNGVLLADNVPVFGLDVTPYYVKNMPKMLAQLQKLVKLSPDDLKQFYKDLKRRPSYAPIPLKIKLTEVEVAKFSESQYRFPGVLLKARMIRDYPLGPTTVAALGYVGRINAQELAHLDPVNYSVTNFIGKTGIEKYYEAELHGTVGYKQVEVNASGRPLRVLKYVPPINGTNLHLTIDSKLQQVAIKALGKQEGAVVAIQPNTGQILALVSTPTFNPNLFVQGISSKQYAKLTQSPNMPLYNRATRGQFPMASTIKPFLALEGLDVGVITPSYTIFDPGWFRLPGTKHIYHDWKRGGHGRINLTRAITVSCDTYFYNLSVLLGIQRIDDILTRFGFGQPTGIDMPEESIGLVPSPAWKKRHEGEPWYIGDTVISAIGQGFMLTTPLQLADATVALANRGLRFKPDLLLQQDLPNGQTINYTPIAEDPVMIQHPKAWNIVIKAMEDVVTNIYGTARLRFGTTPPYTVAAKTGTGQVISKRYRDEDAYGDTHIKKSLRDHSLFIAFAPVKNPKIAIAVIVEHSPIAGTVARKVLDYYLLHKPQKPQKKLKQKHETIQPN